ASERPQVRCRTKGET
ncbi:hypothetical protein BV102_01200B, partial [Haemophilus influenzae]